MNKIQFSPDGRDHHKLMYVFILMVMPIIVLFTSDVVGMSSDVEVLAVGDGFELTQNDVEAIKIFYEKTHIRTTDKEYQKTTLRIKLFAKEATALGLNQEIDVPPEGKDSTVYLLKLQSVYTKHVLESYPVSDVVIESYYRTFPYRFRTGPDEKPVSKESPVPMNSEIKKMAREFVVEAIKKRIESEAEEKLKEKYHVKLTGLQGGK